MRKYFSLFLLPFLLGGCNWWEFPAYVLFGKTHEKVKAEYNQLKGKRVAIIIAGLPAIDFEDPYARMDLALASAELIRQEVKKVQFVEQEKIERFQQENLDWISMPMSEIGNKFGADRRPQTGKTLPLDHCSGSNSRTPQLNVSLNQYRDIN